VGTSQTAANPFSTLSLTGLGLATASALLAFLPSLYPVSFAFTQPLGFQVSLAAVLFAVCEAWRPNPLRWHALACGCRDVLVLVCDIGERMRIGVGAVVLG